MKKSEFIRLAQLIRGLYPREDRLFSDMVQVDIWYPMLQDLDYDTALRSIQNHAKESSYPPSIADIRQKAKKHYYDGEEIQRQLLAQFMDEPEKAI